jgi:chromosome segregation ATPase
MIRKVCLAALSAAVLMAQDKPADPLTAARGAAEKAAADWDSLAKGLDSKITRLLPCDPRVQNAIEDVSRASQARLTALREYLEAAIAKTKDDAEALKRFTAYRESLSREINTERSEAEQMKIGIDGQLTQLGQNAGRRTALDASQKVLANLAEIAKQQVTLAQEQSSLGDVLGASLAELDAGYQARQKALETELALLTTETVRWAEYYATRLARSQTECAITNTAPQTPRSTRGKKR